jgi:hypothetical protein
VARRFGRIGWEFLSGTPGSGTNHHGCPYAITEEFVAIYRMHPLLPDAYVFRSSQGEKLMECDFRGLFDQQARSVLQQLGLENVVYSFATMSPGAVTLHNYPNALRALTKKGELLDVAAIDIARDRERGVPRYNDFRELLHLPRKNRFEELNPEHAEDLKRVYKNIDRVDLLVGLLAESPPRGFAFSDTAFRVFILMASRRMKSDRFYTADYRPAIYTPEGIAWVENNDLKSVLMRHLPGLAHKLAGVQRIFGPWG